MSTAHVLARPFSSCLRSPSLFPSLRLHKLCIFSRRFSHLRTPPRSPRMPTSFISVVPSEIRTFQQDGHLVLHDVLCQEAVEACRARLEPLFHGEFETGNYPDEWHWRAGMSLPHVTREICNAWKCDLTLASIVLSSGLAQTACKLMGWKGARIAQDAIWYKPQGGGTPVSYHTDAPYISDQFAPRDENSITCWVALDDVDPSVGTIEYATGSHRWREQQSSSESLSGNVNISSTTVGLADFHAPKKHYRDELLIAAQAAGIVDIAAPAAITCRAGSIAFHHQDLWHGSGPNLHPSRPRRSLGIHLLREDVQFKPNGQVGYIYGRYKHRSSLELHEDFFPILYRVDGYRTPYLDSYCPDAMQYAS